MSAFVLGQKSKICPVSEGGFVHGYDSKAQNEGRARIEANDQPEISKLMCNV